MLVDLVDRGLIRILDLVFLKNEPESSRERRGGAQLVASGRIPADELVTAVDAAHSKADAHAAESSSRA